MRAVLILFALAAAGCLRKTEFQCANDTACGTAGTCEPSGYCSFADAACASGRRYDDSAGTLAGACTDDSGGTDAGGGGDDAAPPTDGGTADTSSNACPAGYAPLAGVPGHLYKVVPTAAGWVAQHDACKLTSASAYLAVPDTVEELTALDAIANAATYWVGITDSATEGTWLTVLGTPQTFLPWQPPAPDNAAGGQGEDCVEAIAATHRFDDRRCNLNRPAICECAP